MPFAISYDTKCHIRGRVEIRAKELKPFMIHYGFHEVPIVEKSIGLLDVSGTLIFNGTAYVGRGSRIVVHKGAVCELGNRFAISAASFVYCYKHVKFGTNVQLSWNDLIMDSDSHAIFDESDKRLNNDKEILIGNDVWIACDCKVLKGAMLPNNCVVGANSIVTSKQLEESTLVTGTPAKSVRKISKWEI